MPKLFILLVLMPTTLTFAEPTHNDTQVKAWLSNDSDDLPSEHVNFGKLKFLKKPPKQKVHHHHNTLFVAKESMDTGWIKLLQCHANLDHFPRAQIVYRHNPIKNLKITHVKNIQKAWIEKNTVQLLNVKNNARLCVEFDSKALHKNKDGSYTISNGPFMRRFLDGYYPMRVSLDVKLPKQLRFVSISPNQQNGFRVKQTSTGVHFDAWFEGKLYTTIKLMPVKP